MNTKAPPFVEAMRERWQRQVIADHPRLQPNYARVAMAINWHLNRDTGDAWPSIATLAQQTRLSERTVKRAVACLEGRGHMHVVHSPGRTSNHYKPILNGDTGDTVQCANGDSGDTVERTQR